MLKNDFVPVAIDQWYQRKQKDAEGDFYRKIASQGPRKNFQQTTQGRYICTADGTLLAFNNNYGPERIRKLMKEALVKFDPTQMAGKVIEADKVDPRFDKTPPANGLILRVHSKVLSGYESTDQEDFRLDIFQSAIGRDNAWFHEKDKTELMDWIGDGGEMPKHLAQRIARYHLIDNTRGEPPRWTAEEIKSLSITIDNSGTIKGSVHLETSHGKRGYKASLYGKASLGADSPKPNIQRFDLVAKGNFWGRGQFTGFAPKGKFPLAIAFRIADGTDLADKILPHGSKGWLEGYYSK
jgi:hypothetical protein